VNSSCISCCIDMTYGTQAFRPYKEPEVTTQSTKETLSKHYLMRTKKNLLRSNPAEPKLKKIDAKMYGVFWAPSTIDQLQAFGKEAMKGFPYVSAFLRGTRREGR